MRALLALAALRSEVTGTASVEAHLGGSRARRPHRLGPRPRRPGRPLRPRGRRRPAPAGGAEASGGAALDARSGRGGGGERHDRADPRPPLEAEVRSEGVDLAEVLDRLGVTGPGHPVAPGRREGHREAPAAGARRDARRRRARLQVADALLQARRWRLPGPGLRAGAAWSRRSASRGRGCSWRAAGSRGAGGAGGRRHPLQQRRWLLGADPRQGGSRRPRAHRRYPLVRPRGGRGVGRGGALRQPAHHRPRQGRGLPLPPGGPRQRPTDFRYQDFLLHLERAQGTRGAARYQGEVVVDLRSPAQVVSSRLEGRGRMHDMCDAVMEWLPRTRYLRDAMDGEAARSAGRPGPRRRARRVLPGAVRGGDLPRPRVRVRSHRGADPGRPDRPLRGRGAAAGRGDGADGGDLGMEPPFPWDLDVSFAGLALADLDVPAARSPAPPAGPPRSRGSFEHPRVRFAASGAGVRARGVRARDGPGRRHHRRAAPRPHRRRRGARPRRRGPAGGAPALHRERGARAGGRRAARPGRSAGRPASAGGRARQRRGRPRGPPRARGSLELSQLGLSVGDVKVEAVGPAQVPAPRRPPRAAPALPAQPVDRAHPGGTASRGRAGLERLGGADLRAGRRRWSRRSAAPERAAPPEAHLGRHRRRAAAGRLPPEFPRADFQLRGTTANVSGVSGGLTFSQSRVLFEGLTALVNGGKATLEGEVELSRLAPVPAAGGGGAGGGPGRGAGLPPRHAAAGGSRRPGTPDATHRHRPAPRGPGPVHRRRGFGGQPARAAPPPVPRRPAPYDRAGEWLRFDLQLVVDGDVRVENDLVRGPVSGRATLTGTLASPGLGGTLAMGAGQPRRVPRQRVHPLARGARAHRPQPDRHRARRPRRSPGAGLPGVHARHGPLEHPAADAHQRAAAPPAGHRHAALARLHAPGRGGGDRGGRRRHRGRGPGAPLQPPGSTSRSAASCPAAGPSATCPCGSPAPTRSRPQGRSSRAPSSSPRILRDRLRLRFQAPLAGARGRTAQAELRLGEAHRRAVPVGQRHPRRAHGRPRRGPEDPVDGGNDER